MVRRLKLTATPPGAARRPARPAGVHVTAEDIHRRVVNRDFFPAGSRPVVLRMVGARNGTYSAQALVETGPALGGFSAKAGDLVRTGGGGKIPAAAVRVRYGKGLAIEPNMLTSRFDRHRSRFNGVANSILNRYSAVRFRNRKEMVRPPKKLLEEARAIAVFDHITDRPPLILDIWRVNSTSMGLSSSMKMSIFIPWAVTFLISARVALQAFGLMPNVVFVSSACKCSPS